MGGFEMSRRIRSFAAALTAATLIVASGSPALAFEDAGLAATEAETPVMLDALFLRPMGLLMLGLGTVAMAPTAAVVGLTRPTDLAKPFKVLMANPFRYTFMDPLGSHPPRS
jgi:hypothetical protein